MRVTENTINRRVLRDINSSLRRLDRNYLELSSGKRLHYPSDDPVSLAISLKLRNGLREIEQYKQNGENAIAWLKTTDSLLDELTKVMHRLKEIAVYGANSTLPQSSMDALAIEVNELKNHIWQVANTRHENRYLFAGQQTKTPPYDDSFNYQGDNRPLLAEVGTGVLLEYSVPGPEVFGDIFNELDDLEAHLRNMEHESVSGDLGVLEQRLDQILIVRAALGAKANRLERNIERLDIMDVNYSGLLSKNEDTDIAEAVMRLKMHEHVYEAALATSARILQTTLVNYLR
ncbi:MAG TPA: flagellar hook-associated protein FlgL [Firmicutes bacterium]|jgi:flagellar hook-associated protein 3 FlgL|nr:flagellar hook-associated protein FlgL [Bacillota bacterium]